MTKPVWSHITLLQINTLCCQQKKWNRKEDKCTSMICIVCTVMAKGMSQEKAISSSEEIKPVALVTARNMIVLCAPQLSSETEVSIALLCQLCSTCYTAVRIKKCLKSTSVLKVATMKNTDDFSLRKGSHHVQHQINAFHCQSGTQRRTLVSPWRVRCTYSGTPKGTSRAEATSNSEKIKPVSLAVTELCLSEGIRQAGS